MKKLLNTLYVTKSDVYLSLDGENVVVLDEGEQLLRVPLHNLEGIVAFGYTGASPALMGACCERQISLSFMSKSGRFLASVVGAEQGNVLLRRTQYRVADDDIASIDIARNMLVGKLFNSRWMLERAARDHAMRVDVAGLKDISASIAKSIQQLHKSASKDSLRGIEGEAATRYFAVFDELILQNKEDFYFRGRSRRPPLDKVNAMLSLAYVLLASEAASALSAVGLDPFVGVFHTDKPGRRSLALDLMEELRPVMADRFVISLVNTRQVAASDFVQKESGAVLMKDDARKTLLTAWQNKKQEKIEHPFLKEKIEWGLVSHIQALLLARFLRGDLDEYPPVLWK